MIHPAGRGRYNMYTTAAASLGLFLLSSFVSGRTERKSLNSWGKKRIFCQFYSVLKVMLTMSLLLLLVRFYSEGSPFSCWCRNTVYPDFKNAVMISIGHIFTNYTILLSYISSGFRSSNNLFPKVYTQVI